MRGARSRPALARRLKVDPNVLYMWESGLRSPRASVLFRVAAATRTDLTRLSTFLAPDSSPCAKPGTWGAKEMSALVAIITKGATAMDVARAAATDRSTVARWRRGDSEPRLPAFLQLVHTFTHRLIEWLDFFVSAKNLSEVRALCQAVEAQRGLAYERPWSHAVLRALELKKTTAASQVSQIAAALNLEPSEVEGCLAQLKSANLVRKTAGRWTARRVLTVDTATDAAGNLALKRHWGTVAESRLHYFDGNSDSLYSYNVMAVSNEDLQRIKLLHAAYFEQVRSIVSESRLAERVVLLNLQLVALDESA